MTTATTVRNILLKHAAEAGYTADWAPDEMPLAGEHGLKLDEISLFEALTEVEETFNLDMLDHAEMDTIGDVIRAVEQRVCCAA